ncbi:MAG: DUF4124 domain-containing protein [Proteobacteria bacterium]|nr:DUF4124 domain-containing protein [Pseudomonadota bacterium]
MKTLIKLMLYLLVLYAQAVSADAVYKGTDKEGRTIYSDQPIENGEKITITLPPTFNLPKAPAHETKTTTAEVVDYKISIIEPHDQQTFTNDIRQVEVKLALTPNLQAGDRINLMVNGKPYGHYSQGLTFTLHDFPRGAYKVNAIITSEQDPDKVKAQSSTIIFYQQRAIAKRDVAPQLAPQGQMAPQAP